MKLANRCALRLTRIRSVGSDVAFCLASCSQAGFALCSPGSKPDDTFIRSTTRRWEWRDLWRRNHELWISWWSLRSLL